MLQSTFEEARAHLQIVLGIDVQNHLDVRHPKQFTTYALIGALVVAYRYAEALGENTIIFDMTTSAGGHVSHQYGTDLDFEYGPGAFDPVNQANVISDMLRVREVMDSDTKAFRLGFYFDFFNDADAIRDVRTFADFQRRYGHDRRSYKRIWHRRLSSMHLGVRYKFESKDYEGDPTPSSYGPDAFWGRGKHGYGRSSFWERRIRSWDIGFIRERAVLVAAAALKDLATLDQNPPTLVVLGAMGAGPVP